MPEEIKNIFDDVVELKKANPWLGSFALTDNEVKEVIKLISRVILGSVKADNFFESLSKIVRKDQATLKKLALIAIENRLLPLKDQLGDLSGLLAKLGSSLETIEAEVTAKPVPTKTTVSFSPEDDAEIQKIISTVQIPSEVRDYNSLAELIIAESGYDINGDEVILNRLRNAIVARLKDIRDELETTETLTRSRKIGGLEMTEEQAKKIISLIKEKISQGLLAQIEKIPVAANQVISFPAKKPFVKAKTTLEAKKNEAVLERVEEVRNEPVPKATSIAMPQIEDEEGLPVIKMPPGEELKVRPRPVIQEVKPVSEIQTEKKEFFKASLPEERVKFEPVRPITSTAQPIPEPQPQIRPVSLPKALRSNKPSVDGVRIEPILVGPVEELGTMTLINFRRLGETPHQAIKKIKEKIDLLEKESYARKLSGIEAWHKNEINRFYRLLGQESMSQNRGVEDIINERLRTNKPTLSIEEFNSIMELNKQLRY